jgi:hypothetical protein
VPIETACPDCRKSYSLADTQRGKTVVCRACKATFVVEDEEDRRPSRASRRDEEDDRPSRRTRRDEDDRDRDPDRRPSRRDRDEEEEGRRTNKKQRSGGGGLLLWLLIGGGGGLLLLCGGVVVAFLFAIGKIGPNRVTKENFNKVQRGMSQAELEDVLGLGKDTTEQSLAELERVGGKALANAMRQSGYKFLTWERGENKITATLRQNKAQSFTGVFVDENGATWRMQK